MTDHPAREDDCTFMGCGAEATREVIGHRLCAMHAELYQNFLGWRRPQPTDILDMAAEVIARHILAKAADDEALADWEDYPDIAEGNWDRVDAALARLVPPFPEREEYQAAYELLSADEGDDA